MSQAASELHGGLMQTIHDGFQHEQPDYWLNFGNPWEIERLNIAYTIKFYGHVSVQEEGGRQTFRWNPGESVQRSLKHTVARLMHFIAHILLAHCSDRQFVSVQMQLLLHVAFI